MRFLLILGVLVFGVWLWRSQRNTPEDRQPGPRQPKAGALPQEMIRCRQCGMHLPAAEAVLGKLGNYCCTEHLKLSEP